MIVNTEHDLQDLLILKLITYARIERESEMLRLFLGKRLHSNNSYLYLIS